MRNLFILASAFLLVSCAHSKSGTASGADTEAGHVCGPDCGCNHGEGHGDKAAGYHAEGMPEGGHTMTNVTEHVEALFTKLDADKDAALTKEEIGEHHLAQKFEMADADSDGKISREEMMAFGAKMHSKMETKEAAPAPEAEAVPETEAPAAETATE